MAVQDALRQLFGAVTNPGMWNEVGQLALGGQQGYAQQQENTRQTSQLAAEAARQKAKLAQQQSNQDAIQQQAAQQQQLEVLKALGMGQLQGAAPNEPGAVNMTSGYKGDPDLWVKAGIAPRAQTMTIPKDSKMGQFLNLTQDMNNVAQDKYLDIASRLAEKTQKSQQDQDFVDALQVQGKQLHSDIDQRFSPQYFESLYGAGNIPPNLDTLRQRMHDELDTAMTIDSRKKNTDAVNSFKSQLNNPTDWEKQQQRKQDRDYAEHLAVLQNRMEYENKYPAPTEDQIKTWMPTYRQNGVRALSAAHQLNPRLEAALEQQGIKEGISPSVLTNEEINNRGMARVAMSQLDRAQNILSQPGIEQRIGPALSRWRAFQSGTIGSAGDQSVKTLQDSIKLALGNIGKIHYTARGAANEHIQSALKSLADADKMDLPTLTTGINSLRDILNAYSTEGDVNPIAGALGVGGGLGFEGKK